jgi:hypothetical protein
MLQPRFTSLRILTFIFALFVVFGKMSGVQSPVLAQPPQGEEPTLTLQVIPDGDNLSIAAISPIPVFEVGDRFKVSIVALGVDEPGIFGSQFEISYETDFLQAVAGSLVSGSTLTPVVNAVNQIDQENGLVKFAASRQGNLDNLTGNIVLATLTFEAVGATEPPEGQTTTLDLQNVKLGAKGGIAVPVSGIVDLSVIIREGEVPIPGPGDIVGVVKVQGRGPDNQAGHQITATGNVGGVLNDTTEADGSFWLDNAAADTYTLVASRTGFLAATCEEVSHTTDVLTELAEVTLLAGDIDEDNVIDITDAVAIGVALGSTDAVANLNADGQVDILDLILLAANFGQTSAANPWTCQLPANL